MSKATSRLKSDLLLGLALRGAGAVSSFAFAWMIAQLLGARAVGLYQIGFTTALFFAAVAVLSQDTVLVRQLSPLIRDGRLEEASQRFRGIRQFVLKLGVALGLTAAALAFPLAEHGLGDPAIAPFIIALAPAILLLPMMRIHNALLRVLGRVKLSQSLEGVSYVSIAMLTLAAVWLFASDWLFPMVAPLAILAGLIVSVAAGYRFVGGHLKRWPQNTQTLAPDFRGGAWIAAAPIIGQAGNWLIVLIITAFLSAADAGIFRIAVLTCTLMQLVNTAFATMAGPYLARAAEAGDLGQVRKTILIAGGIGLLVSSPVAILALLLPEWIMGLFGPEFVSGAMALQLLAIGQLINVAAGPVGIAMIMQNRERLVLAVEAVASGAGLLIAIILVPKWGIAGAAFGLLIAALIRNGVNWLLAWFHKPQPKLES